MGPGGPPEKKTAAPANTGAMASDSPGAPIFCIVSFTMRSIAMMLFHPWRSVSVSAEELAERACTIEIERCRKPIGKQDQYIAALGGIRDIRFGPGDEVEARELGLSAAGRRALQQQIMLFYTGVTRSADSILVEQRSNIESTRPQLDLLRDLAGFAAGQLRNGDVDAIGATMVATETGH